MDEPRYAQVEFNESRKNHHTQCGVAIRSFCRIHDLGILAVLLRFAKSTVSDDGSHTYTRVPDEHLGRDSRDSTSLGKVE